MTVILADEPALDAVVCLLAAQDFLPRRCAEPTDLELARYVGVGLWLRAHSQAPVAKSANGTRQSWMVFDNVGLENERR